tara:strand:- start:1170 stop:2648 length:1479 start_codon:yes stop_codon:yes gene_type:complete
MNEYTYLDASGNVRTSTIDAAMLSAEKMAQRFKALGEKYRERESLLMSLQLAQATGENVLVIGPPGSGKSALLRDSMDIKGAHTWSMDMTEYTTEANIFGAYDPRELETSGRMWHMTEGTLSEANFAHLGEIFDANMGTLRSLLGALNEKDRRNGSQYIRIPLVSAVADTNFRPEDMPERAEKLRAVVDRFIFKEEIDYIQDEQVDFDLHLRHLEGDFFKPLPELHLEDVERVMGLVLASSPNILKDRYVLSAYLEVKREMNQVRAEKGLPPISTRRSIRGQQAIEAFAVFQGRTQATFDDLWSILPVLRSSMEDGSVVYQKIESSVKTWVAKEALHEVEIEITKLNQKAKYPQVADMDTLSVGEAFAYIEAINTVIDDLKDAAPKTLEGRNFVRIAIGEGAAAKVTGYRHILGRATSMLPADLHTPPKETLTALQSEVKAVGEVLKKIPQDSAYLTERTHLESRVDLAHEILLRRFADEELDELLSQWGTV